MSEESGEQLDSYKQVGSSSPTDSYQPGSGKQRIDLDEYYKETGQQEGTVMMQGFEQLSMGKLSREVAKFLDLPGAGKYDPFPSERNARNGTEGFFGYVAEKFKEGVDAIIKYIRMAIDWIVDLIKTIFGFRKSARITKEIDDSLDDLKEEFAETLKGLGFPAKDYNVEAYLGDLPSGKSPVMQLHILKSKMDKDVDSIAGLSNALPLIKDAVAKLTQASNKVDGATSRFKRTLKEEHKQYVVRRGRGERLSMGDAPEAVRVAKAIQEVKSALDVQPIGVVVGKVYEELYKVSFTNEELTEGFDKVRAKLKQDIHTQTVKLAPQDIPLLFTGIQALNKRYQEISDKQLDLSGIKWKELGNLIDKSDADKIDEMNDFYGYTKLPTQHQLSAEYQRMTIEVRNFTQFCFSVSQSLMIVQKQIINLVEWHNRTHAYYMGGVIGDLDTMMAAIADAKKNGHNPVVDSKGRPQPLMFIKEADAKTFMERASGTLHAVIEPNMKELKETYNNFARQVGWRKA